VWTPGTSIPSGSDYFLEIVQVSGLNYSPQFSITGRSATTTSRSASSSSPTTTVQTTQTATSSSPTSTTSSNQQISSSQSSNPSTASTTSNPATASSPSSPSLTTGDKAAIGVGVPFGVLVLGVATFFLGRLSKSHKRAPSKSAGGVITVAEKSELDGNGVPITRSELPASGGQPTRYELSESRV
jgi:hypothetical protein